MNVYACVRQFYMYSLRLSIIRNRINYANWLHTFRIWNKALGKNFVTIGIPKSIADMYANETI